MKKKSNPSFLKVIILSIIIQMLPFYSSAQTKSAALDKLMTHYHANGIFNGTVLVSENGNIIYRNAFGYSNKETKQQLTPKSCFNLASVSKQFTTMGIMILKENNKLSYDDKLIKYFPEFPAYANEITIRNLMNHTSGLQDYGYFSDKDNLTNLEILEILVNRDKLNFKPGEKYAYNNGGYVMLALIIEKISGLPLSDFLKKNIFDPLKMKNTSVYNKLDDKIKNRVISYTRIGEIDDHKISHTGSTSMFSNVDDLFLWQQSLSTQKLVSKKTMEEAFTPTTLNDGSISNYGFGWRINKDKQQNSVEHSGRQFGYRTFIKRDLTKNNSYILLTNYGDAIALNDINLAIDNILSSNPYTLPKNQVFSKLKEAIDNNSVDVAIAITKKAIKEKPNDFDFNSEGINELGYKYLRDKKINDAFSLFKFNVELNPKSSNAYDSLGEIYLVLNDTLNAVDNYKKSVKLDPNNSNAIKTLTKLGISSEKTTSEFIVPTEVLKTYEGKYQLNKNYFFTVTSKEQQLFIQGTGEAITTVFPMSENRFYSKIITAQFTFNKDVNGKIESLTLNMGTDITAQKVN